MEFNTSYLKSNQSIYKATNLFFYLNVTQSEVKSLEYIDNFEVYRRAQLSHLMAVRYVAFVISILILLCNLTVVISSGLIVTKGQQRKSTYLLLGNVYADMLISASIGFKLSIENPKCSNILCVLQTGQQKKSTYLLLGNLSLADMLVSVSTIFKLSIENPRSSNILCVLQTGLVVGPTIVSIFSVGLIAVDRYVYILHGLYYKRWVTTTKIRICILLTWILGIVLGFLPATGWVNNELKATRCYYVALFPGELILLNSFLSIITITVVGILYSIILIQALKKVRQIKANGKTAKSNTPQQPELRINRGDGNLSNDAQSANFTTISYHIIIKRSFSFNAGCDYRNESKNCPVLRKSKSIDNFININRSCFKNIVNVKSKVRGSFESKVSVNTQSITLADTSISVEDLDKCDKNVSKNIVTVENNMKKKSRPKEPNKWRAITVVMLTSGSFIVTWMPYFITMIFFVFCEEKLTNPKCMKIRFLVGTPLAMLAFLNSILNPLIYAWWHKGFKKSVKFYFQRYFYKYIIKNTNR